MPLKIAQIREGEPFISSEGRSPEKGERMRAGYKKKGEAIPGLAD